MNSKFETEFERSGYKNFVKHTGIGEYVKHLEQGNIKATRCKNCKEIYFPPKANCDSCLSSDMEWIDFPNKCTLITYSELQFAPGSFEEDTPYIIGIAEFDEEKRVFSRVDVAKEEIKIGMELELTPRELENDRVVHTLVSVEKSQE